jgi:hypothetical protein
LDPIKKEICSRIFLFTVADAAVLISFDLVCCVRVYYLINEDDMNHWPVTPFFFLISYIFSPAFDAIQVQREIHALWSLARRLCNLHPPKKRKRKKKKSSSSLAAITCCPSLAIPSSSLFFHLPRHVIELFFFPFFLPFQL